LLKRYSPVVLEAIADLLRATYWYKDDLRRFVEHAGLPTALIQAAAWDQYKRHIARDLVSATSKRPDGKSLLDDLIDALLEQPDHYPHLARLRDGEAKVSDAQQARRKLKALLKWKTLNERARRAAKSSKAEARRHAEKEKKKRELVVELQTAFVRLVNMDDRPQDRGREFNDFLRRLFDTFDLDPRGSFVGIGEETDGSIRLDGRLLLVEAKWEKSPIEPAAVGSFRNKVRDKLETTLGLFISMSSFTDAAVKKTASGRRLVVLIDGEDLAPVIQGILDLRYVLQEKLREASESGEVLYRVEK